MSLLKHINQANPQDDGGNTHPKTTDKLGTEDSEPGFNALRARFRTELLTLIDPASRENPPLEARTIVEEPFRERMNAILAEEAIVLSRTEKSRLHDSIISEIFGAGPLETLLADETVTTIMINSYKSVFMVRKGQFAPSGIRFDSDEHLLKILNRMVAPFSLIDAKHPILNVVLADGSHLHAVTMPVVVFGTVVTIQKFSRKPLSLDDLLRWNTITPEAAKFLEACVIARMNIVVSGHTGSGRTALLNALANLISDHERIVTIETNMELRLRHEQVISLVSHHPIYPDISTTSTGDLIRNAASYMMPDRIIVGECLAGETLELLQAINTGHDGVLTTVNASTPRDTLSRLETMCRMSGIDWPIRAIREQIASAVDLIVHIHRLRDGRRQITSVTEVLGMEGDTIVLSPIFEFEQTGVDQGKVMGRLRPTGMQPKRLDKIANAGIMLPPSLFGVGRRTQNSDPAS